MTMSQDDRMQPREGETGRFASWRRPAPSGVVQNESMASFSFPPSFYTAEEHLSFYMRAPVSERILSNARFAYSDMMDNDWIEYSNALTAVHNLKANGNLAEDSQYRIEQSRFQRANPMDWEEKMKKERFDKWMEMKGHPQMQLGTEEVEVIARAGQAYRKSGFLPEKEQEIVDNFKVVFYGEGDTEFSMTIKEISSDFQTSRWIDDAVTDTDLRVARAMERMAFNISLMTD